MATSTGRWVRYNLFPTLGSSVLSVIVIPLSIYVVYLAARWTFFQAHWAVITDNLPVLLLGTFPRDQYWRTFAAGAIFSGLIGITIGAVLNSLRKRGAVVTTLVATVIALASMVAHSPWIAGAAACIAIAAGSRAAVTLWPAIGRGVGLAWVVGLAAICAFLEPVGVDQWGGLLASLLVTAVSTLISIPLGILVAFGRNSRFSSLRIICGGYVELVRSVPVICIIYWAWIIVPLIFPADAHISDLARGITAFILFYAAYTAEYVRAGIQGVNRGQGEAAQALGFSKLDESFIIVLPQALKSVIPALVGNVLDLFNNVPALFIIGLTDFLKAGQTVLSNPQYSGSQYEVYAFLFAVYLAIGALISYVASRIEGKMSKGAR